jgi:hypothetical protein
MVIGGYNVIKIFVVPSVKSGLPESSFKGLDYV